MMPNMYWTEQADAILEDLLKEHGKKIEEQYDAIREELLAELQPVYIRLEGNNFNKKERKKVIVLVAAIINKHHPIIRDEVARSSYNSAVVGSSSVHYSTEMIEKIKLPLSIKAASVLNKKYSKSKIHNKYTAKKLSDNKSYSDRVRGHNGKLIIETTNKVGRGVTEAEGWIKLDEEIKRTVDKTKGRVKNIQEVESNRVKEEARADAAKAEEEYNIIKTKTWKTVLDPAVRDTHMSLHDVEIPIDEVFETANGTAMHPHGFGIPSEDINCRCRLEYNTVRVESNDDLSKGFEGVTDYNDWMSDNGYIVESA